MNPKTAERVVLFKDFFTEWGYSGYRTFDLKLGGHSNFCGRVTGHASEVSRVARIETKNRQIICVGFSKFYVATLQFLKQITKKIPHKLPGYTQKTAVGVQWRHINPKFGRERSAVLGPRDCKRWIPSADSAHRASAHALAEAILKAERLNYGRHWVQERDRVESKRIGQFRLTLKMQLQITKIIQNWPARKNERQTKKIGKI